ncbi:hypothetical protein PCANC_21317 [Puccinia coronata f. sp. avenae]|uniref:Uncharacterized protein n=1 Tax=Puccinia coronata f. sp. avenae TaxID=200324 RepID=A0A2N5UJP0_9BASI|nr:hypothetical protein PCANC_21317 [Puccinia coronata f. sp. avenae]
MTSQNGGCDNFSLFVVFIVVVQLIVSVQVLQFKGLRKDWGGGSSDQSTRM